MREISERCVQKGFEVEVLTTDPSGTLPKKDTVNGVQILRFRSWAPNGAYYFPHPQMVSNLSKSEVGIIHAHSIHSLTTLAAYLGHNFNMKTKFIISTYYHGKGHTKFAEILWKPYKPVAHQILKKADGIIVNSKTQKVLVERTFNPSSKIFIVYDGVNLQKIRNAKPLNSNEHHKILLYVGRLEKYKNIQVTISSLKYLPKNYHFYIIGGGPFKPFLKNLAHCMGLRTRVHFLGFQPDAVVYRWLKTADVFVLLSEVESFGMTCIESLAANIPVIANDDGLGLSETISFYPECIMVHRTNKEPASELAKLIIKVAELKPIRADISNFSWDRIAENISNVYKQILMKQ